jgi:hypothetical protein
LPAVGRFNQRLASGGNAPFLIPEEISAHGSLDQRRMLVVGDDSEVHGGCLLQVHAAWIASQPGEAANIQSPLSEGLVDRRHAAVAAWMMKEVVRQYPHAYSVGMGSPEAAYPRLLTALRWKVALAPFFFRVLSGRRFLAHLQPLKTHRVLRYPARVLAALPFAGDLLFDLAHAVRRRGTRAAAVSGAPRWEDLRVTFGFAVDRGPATLDAMYPPGDARFSRVSVPGGSAILATTHFQGHRHFGSARASTLVDILAHESALGTVIAAAERRARELGADLMLSNQSAPRLCAALRDAGWFGYASNYLVALSSALAAAVGDSPVYVTRGDGDGLINL